VAPGSVWTALNPSAKSSNGITQFGAQTLMMRPGQPEEIAPAYVFLASAQCSSYTGGILPIIGGYAGG
jgi:NAD(P)-dependent dehydrogenase (short-subunit alcohol dehydrogenase family)